MATIARTESFCTCGVRIEISDEVLMRPGGAIHPGCRERAANGETKTTVTESTGGAFLFNEMETRAVEHAAATLGVNRVSFDGPSLLAIDTPRLAGQIAKVYMLMSDGRFRKLAEIATFANCLETFAGARLRDFRKAKFGGHEVISRHVGNGVYEYKLILNSKRETNERHVA